MMTSKMTHSTLFITASTFFLFQFVECEKHKKCQDPLEEKYGKLLHASVVFRHGDRSPLRSYPLDPYQNYTWPVPSGELLDKGKRRLFRLGKLFRQRYNCLVPANYDSNAIFVQSTDRNRAIMSAECFLYGFYYESSTNDWNEHDSKWVPVPVHTIPIPLDNMLRFQRVLECPKYMTLAQAVDQDKRVIELLQDKYNFFVQLEQHTGMFFTNVTRLQSILDSTKLLNTLQVQQENNLILPDWVDIETMQLLDMISKLGRLFSLTISNNEMAQLFVSPFLRSIIADMVRKNMSTTTNDNEVDADNEFSQTLHIYSGHDLNIDYPALYFNEFYPFSPYGSNLIFELRDLNGSKFVTVCKMNDTDNKEWILLRSPRCGYACSLQEFVTWIEEITVEDWQKTCDEHFSIHN